MTARAMCLSYCGLRIADCGLIVDCVMRIEDWIAKSAMQSAIRNPRWLRRFAEEDHAQVVLQQERIGDAQPREQPDDVAVEQDRLPPPQRGVRPVFQVHLVDDDE